jgi:ABC-2 type transport system ATP-binding protein
MNTPIAPAISISQLSFSYVEQTILQDINIEVPVGSVYALLGGNGAGKSTLIKLILGLIKPQKGSIHVMGVDVLQNPMLARHNTAYVPETVMVYPELTGKENIRYFLQLTGKKPTADQIEQVMANVGLASSAWNLRAASYSKGMRQKLIIATALLRQVPLVLLDEPGSGLDPKATDELNALIAQLKNSNITVLMVSHDLASVAQIADHYAFLRESRIQSSGYFDDEARQNIMQFRSLYDSKLNLG